ncbi:unnamed protein product [Dovyalis caffra]|uniref:SH3 domain-containing protein n=1 Tax=Dovyalis caffra TaxID=77055 RepID=A0AAV1SFR2_9ROSI|nr:unnamed protein product [Dovyalis caffra]
MDALRKQASKLREQVAKQQQAVIKQFSGTGYESSDVMVIDEVEMHRHQQLEKLYRSTRSGKYVLSHFSILSVRFGRDSNPIKMKDGTDFQKDIVKAAEAFTAIGYRHIEAGTKLSEDCWRYGAENINENILAKAAAIYGDACKHVEQEQEDLNHLLSAQILEPLRAMINGTPLEDARHLAQRYSRMRQEAEAQAAEVSRRQARVRESPIPENIAKLHAAEARMQELKANMAVLGKEAAAALAAVEAQQHRLTFQRLVAMVEGQKNYHLRIAAILSEVEAEMVSEKQQKESAPPVILPPAIPLENGSEKTTYFLAEATHPFIAETEKELSLAVGDYIVVRKVSPTGWSEGECKGKAGWFPSAYAEKRQRIPTMDGCQVIKPNPTYTTTQKFDFFDIFPGGSYNILMPPFHQMSPKTGETTPSLAAATELFPWLCAGVLGTESNINGLFPANMLSPCDDPVFIGFKPNSPMPKSMSCKNNIRSIHSDFFA